MPTGAYGVRGSRATADERERTRPRSQDVTAPRSSDDLGFNVHHAAPGHAECPRGAEGEVEGAPAHEWAAIVDGDHHAAARLRIGDAQMRPEWQGWVRTCIAGRIERPTGRNVLAF